MGVDDGPFHAGLSGYGINDRGGLREALIALHERMGISGEYVDHRGKLTPMRVSVYEGSDRGTGPDGEDLFAPRSLVYSTRTDAAAGFEAQYRRIYRALRRAGYSAESLGTTSG